MTWAALIAALVAFFGPILEAWLADLLKKVEAKLAGAEVPEEAVVVVHDVFAAARASLSWWDRLRGRGRVLAAFERIALTRAAQIVQRAAKGTGYVAHLTAAELETLYPTR